MTGVASRGAVAGATMAAVAGSVTARCSEQLAANETVAAARDRVVEGMGRLEARVDALEHHHKNLLRVGALAFAVSTGLDLTILL